MLIQMQMSVEFMKTKLPVILLSSLFISSPAFAGYNKHDYHERNYQRGYSQELSCYQYEYREEYIPGISTNPGYVKSYREKVKVPCEGKTYSHQHQKHKIVENPVDDNSCIEGSILGGILGGGAGAALSRGNGRWWAIPLGVVGGTLVGCQVDGG